MRLTDPTTSSQPASRGGTPDEVLAAALDLARAAAVDEAGDASLVGDHLGATADGERLVRHTFAVAGSTARAYPGWYWSVELSRASRGKYATVDEVVLLPGVGALLPQLWLPWAERVQPGDLGPGDLLPPPVDDPRLVLRVGDVEALSVSDCADILIEQGLGRPRALSFDGRLDAAERWYAGDSGPDTPIAQQAPARCRTCGYHVRLVGGLGQVFGVCANSWAPDDGKVVSIDHGCGAHSETVAISNQLWDAPSVEHEYDLTLIETLAVGADVTAEAEGVAELDEHTPGSVEDAEPAEPYGHS